MENQEEKDNALAMIISQLLNLITGLLIIVSAITRINKPTTRFSN